MKVLVVLGTRPEVIKLAPVIRELRGRAETLLCSTGQHRDMLPAAMDAFDLKVDIHLDVMSADQPLNSLAGRIMVQLDDVYARILPDWVLVQGDTTTAFAAGLAAFHRRIRVGHVEAGLRTFHLDDPFPEEANRSLLARIADLHFAPTERAGKNLYAEGVEASRVVVTGNTIVDAMARIRDKSARSPSTSSGAAHSAEPMVLVTCHRREHFGETIEGICRAVARLCSRYPGHHFVFPVHPNPHVHEPVFRLLSRIANLDLIEALPYRACINLMARASLIITDSGGIQEEAPSFGVPTVILRKHTERPEVMEAGFGTLAGVDPDSIEQAAAYWLDDRSRAAHLKTMINPFGDGKASKRIVDALFSADASR